MGPDIDLDKLASMTPGLVGAELRNLVNESALLAARKDRAAVTMEDFSDSLEKVLLEAGCTAGEVAAALGGNAASVFGLRPGQG